MSPHTEIFGVIVERAFEPFFLKIGDHYEGHLWPDVDDRDPHAILPQRVKEAAEEFDVIPVRGYKAAEPKPWSEKTDAQPRPGPYFLQNGRGPSAVLGGTVVRPLITGSESDNTFTLGTIEGSSAYKTQILKGGFKFSTVNHALHVSDGYIRATVDGETERVGPGELLWLPAGSLFSIEVDTRYFKSYIYAQPGGLIDLLYQAGKDNPHTGINCMIPESPAPFDREKLLRLDSQFKFMFQ